MAQLFNTMAPRRALLALALLFTCRGTDAADAFPWARTPLSAFPGTDPENRGERRLSDATVAFLAAHYDVLSLGGGIVDTANKTVCGEEEVVVVKVSKLGNVQSNYVLKASP